MNEEERLIELEIRCALQDELLASLNDTIAKMQDTLDLQQAQLRMLYNKMQQHADNANDNQPYSLAEEIPPHY
ncbi:SlyX family protein [Wielerella bovis]|uniref:SlyX family protein n=1 Tax=Wielerella bovis TaxID=2917790 RepID=UPI00201A0B92|nr:SlyX family protein [Wielerella bovis]ULJ62208.1 SlyX family protein [Wielerella bovis]ULJ64443.1 SlyX family protein [Wielerella bovis]ULJ66721.1 SlyX family protein [Wielerella bovis]ULJ68982.1 SlyX family protein [Wielerella bovis]